MKVRELKGHKSLRALNAFHSYMLGLKFLPAYAPESYETFFDRVGDLPIEDQVKLIREAVMFVEIDQAELCAILSFVEDPNGACYTPANVANLSPAELVEAIVAVLTEIAKMKIDLISDAEKKNLKNSA